MKITLIILIFISTYAFAANNTPRLTYLEVTSAPTEWSTLKVIESDLPGHAKLVAGREIMDVDLNNNSMRVTGEIDGAITVSTDGKSFLATQNECEAYLSKMAQGEIRQTHKFNYSAEQLPNILTHDNQVFVLSPSYKKGIGQLYSVGSVKKDHIARRFVRIDRHHSSELPLVVAGTNAYSYQPISNHLMIDNVLEQNTKVITLPNLQYDQLEITKAEELPDGSIVLAGLSGYALLDKNNDLIKQTFYSDINGVKIAINRQLGHLLDQRDERIVLSPSDIKHLHGKDENALAHTVQIVNVRTDRVHSTPLAQQVTQVFLADDDRAVIGTRSGILVLNETGKVILAVRGPYAQNRRIVRLTGRAFALIAPDDKKEVPTIRW